MRFAFFSCQQYTFGYFHAQALLADEDIDFVVNLGDYIYAEDYYRPGDGLGGFRTDPIGISETLDEYRAKYALYRSEAPLRRMHARFPMISIWDDHEVQDNYAGVPPDGGLAPELALQPGPQGGRLPRLLGEHAHVPGPRAAATGSTRRCASAARST